MEPVELIISIIVWVGTKITEGTLGNVGEKLFDAGNNLWERVKVTSPEVAGAIEGSKQQPLDYGQAVLELESAVNQDPELRQAVQEVATTAQADPQLAEEIKKIREALKSEQPTIQNLAKLAEKIGVVNQGSMNNPTFNVNI
ncbi:hypothetical protein J0895_02545 [Phormidium pseudopriestleyi FRX01]|uniref:Uncharacterized protein n=1 Tax=Phormidium pseudopriestleyi FRX01 TaxID=1759528 RepID=A0ABS3FLM3_9CYAN|nr:hypothetical protein [Phormidium pseudopriestleyi]MBO0348001.1 hypothetical protein [Phormidium pseudopriestleyi FRX01]